MRSRTYLGLIGNGETAALVGPDLSIQWLCLPRFDGSPFFAAALDPRQGGALGLRLLDGAGQPVALVPACQVYVGDTAVLMTVAGGDQWLVTVRDWMPRGEHSLVREVQVTNRGSVPSRCRVEPVITPIASQAFPVSVRHEGPLTEVTAPGAVLFLHAEPGDGHHAPGATAVFRQVMGYGPDHASARAALERGREARMQDEVNRWSAWLEPVRKPAAPVPEHWLHSYHRSLITLKLLSYEPTGALVAAPTASFPAVPGGGDNWDYRYVWLRDGYYTAMTFDAAGLHTEAARFYDFAFALQGEDGHWRQPLYTVDGADPQEFVAPDLQGPGGEQPVRFGNAASAQLQLDNEGNVLHGLWFHYLCSGNRGALERHWPGVKKACAWIAANWRLAESGIWEVREYTAHWVHGKAMCHATLDAGARIAATLGYEDEAEGWRATCRAIREEVTAAGWNQERQAYLRHYGEGSPPPCVDISVLALVFYGLLPPDDDRVKATVALMERDQAEGGLMLLRGTCRYDYAAVPFYLPTLWLARYYLMAGRLDDCDRLLETCLACATDLGLMAEHFDGVAGTQWGNFPQAFSHEELARLILERAQGRSFFQQEAPDRR